MISSLAKGISLILLWPIWTRYLKFVDEGKFQTSHSAEKDQLRQKLNKTNIFSSRARMIEICSESSFQPLLQFYLLLPSMMCFNYSSLLDQDVSDFLSSVPELQFWAIVTSCLSLSWSVNVYQALKKRGALDFGANLIGRILLLAYCICQVTSRLVALVLFAYSFSDGNFYPMIVLVVCHIILMAIIHQMTTDTTQRKETLLLVKNANALRVFEVFYECLLNGISNIYIYNNILLHAGNDFDQPTNQTVEREDSCHPTLDFVIKWKQFIVDLIFGLEMLAIMICSSLLIEGIPATLLYLVSGIYILGLALKVIYYKKFHIWSGF